MQLTSAIRRHSNGSLRAGGADGVGNDDGVDGGCSFAELVHAHYGWRAARRGDPPPPPDDAYRQTLRRFEAVHGSVVSAYWCSYIESAVALTEQRRHFPLRSRLALHRESDWATKRSPQIAGELHRLDELAIRARTVLSGVREAICLRLVAASAAHLLSLADAAAAPDDPQQLDEALGRERDRIDEVQDYYDVAANGQAQIVYFAGMATVALLVSLLGGLVLLLHDHDTYLTGLVALIAGALGAVVSVIQRITNKSFQVDYDIGRPYAFFLGGLRPLIGGTFAIAIAYTFDSGILHLPTGAATAHEQHLALVVVSFLAGFSERWAQDTLATALPQPRPEAPDRPEEGSAPAKD